MKQFSVICCCIMLLFNHFWTFSQETFHTNGVKDHRVRYYAFTNAKIIKDYQTVIENGTLIIKEGKVEAVGAGIPVPKGAKEIDLKGKYIYPSFVDIYSSYGLSGPSGSGRGFSRTPQMESEKKGAYGWNEALRSEVQAKDQFAFNEKEAKELRGLGFGAVSTHVNDGIARGTATVVTLAEDKENNTIILGRSAAHYSFDKGSSQQSYPTSLMGMIALLRQTYLDAQWYAGAGKDKEYNLSLEAWLKNQDVPQIFEVNDKLSVFRADKVGDEFGIQYIIKGTGDEYQRLEAMKATGASFILPLDFPQPYDVSDPYNTLNVALSDMKHWELAPHNPAFLHQKGVEFALTLAGLKDKKDFWKNLRKAIEYGLPEQEALKALTHTPARFLKADDQLGSLAPGRLANFLITSSNIFEKDNIVFENWVQGQQYLITREGWTDLRGTYDLNVETLNTLTLKVTGSLNKTKAAIQGDPDTTKAQLDVTEGLLTLTFSLKKGDDKELIRLSGWTEGQDLNGKGQLQNGRWVTWTATKKEDHKEGEKKKEETIKQPDVARITYPFNGYGWKETPVAEEVLIKNATVWTNEKEGILRNTNVLLKDGKITAIGKDVNSGTARIIDGTGKHLTAGIIDEHSHIAADGGVNEAGESVSAEVRVGDILDSEDINIYRQLSGGVTTSQILHGSANPIGGQSGLIKMRWGSLPEDMKMKGADPFIKFALGENVKQSNWGDRFTVRFPQTRMGVEQVMDDAFTRALDYKAEWEKYHAFPKKEKANAEPPRRDLELETLVEILEKKRFVTCHSYVQSEINMLMKVAERYGFNINTFTHILEGYKVADKMKEHGAGGSTFSDWWAYKYEVIDAIPYNPAIMQKAGVVMAINSDDAEMGRRLNQEAAKSVKYGNMQEEEALKLVTLNPAKLLHIDNRVGSIKAGKDADVVLWNNHPLSVYAKAEYSFVDGICFFDKEQDMKMRDEIEKERMRLIKKMTDAKNGGDRAKKPEVKEERLYHCEDFSR